MMIVRLIHNQTTFPVEIGYCINWIDGPKRKETFALQCPRCGKAFCLANHIVINGVVNPSVVCPFECGFHEHLKIR